MALWFTACLLLLLHAPAQQHVQARTRILARTDDTLRTLLPHSLPGSMAHAALGPRLAASTSLRNLVLVLAPSADQESALLRLLETQQDPTSPNFHQWLTPDTFAQSYGVAPQDLTIITNWLQESGLTVQQVSRSARFISFSGSVGAVEHAFRTELHHITRNGEAHIANTTTLSIPAALAPVVRGLARLDNLYQRNTAIQGAPITLPAARGTMEPLFGTSSTGAHYVSPGDAAVVYDALPLTSAGTDGHGTTIAVIGRSNVAPSTVAAFRSIFGLPVNPLTVTLVGDDPGIGDDAIEAYLDVEWAGALATGSTVQLVTSAATSTSAGIDTASLYAVDNNLGDILTLSYGECESDMTAAGTTFWNTLWQQAAAQGQTVFVSTGDTGAAGCNAGTDSFADRGYGVNAVGSSAWNVAVGGTIFVDYGPAQFWGSTRATPYTSALGYIPEAAWNQGRLGTTELNAASTAVVANTGIAATGGGVSIYTARPTWQTGSQIPDTADPAGIASGSPITGLHRLVPDVAMAASFGHDGSLFCGTGMCTGTGSLNVGVIGGTSLSAPLMASAQALINARNGGRQGNANVIYYALAAKQAAAGLNCQAANGTATSPTVTLPDATCDFHDIVAGSNIVPTNPSGTLGMGFPSIGGFDEATGLGSVDIANLANDWASATIRVPTVTFTLSPATGIAHGTPQAFTVAVTPGSGSGTPTGTITLLNDAGTAVEGSATLAAATLAGTATNLPAGDYSVHAHYNGDTVFAPADSSPIIVSITRATPTAQLTSAVVAVAPGTPVTLQFSLQTPSGAIPPTGTVQFLDTTKPATLCTLSLAATCTTTALITAGIHTLTAIYSGDGNYLPATSPSLQLTVQPTSPTLTLAPGTGVYGTPSTPITATIAPAQSGTLTLSIDTATPIAVACTAVCITPLPLTGVAAGTHTLHATFTPQSGGAAATATTTLTLTPAPATLTLSTPNATYDGKPHAATVTTTPAGLSTDLTYNGQSAVPIAAGTYTVLATLHDPNYTGSATAILRIAPATTLLTFAVPPHSFGDPPFTLAVTSASTGAVTYAVLSGPATLAGNVLTLTGAGTVLLQATQATDGNDAQATAQATVNVAPAPTSLTLTAPSATGTTVTLVATLTSAASPIPGSITFSSDNLPLGTAPLQNGRATLAFTPTAGTHTLAATYAATPNFAAASATLPQVYASAPTYSLAAPAGTAVALTAGTSATLPVMLTATAAYTGTVALSCADLPSPVTCSLSAPSVSLTGSNTPQTVTIQFTASAQHSLLAPRDRAMHLALLLGLPSLLSLSLARRTLGRRAGLLVLAAATLLGSSALTGCGITTTTGATAQSTATGVYTVHIVAADGASVQTLPVTLTLK